jgi:hypothetical protein
MVAVGTGATTADNGEEVTVDGDGGVVPDQCASPTRINSRRCGMQRRSRRGRRVITVTSGEIDIGGRVLREHGKLVECCVTK